MSADGAHVEIVDSDQEPGGPLVPARVLVNGTDVGRLARVPRIHTHAGEPITVTLVLLPCQVSMTGPERSAASPIGFA